MRAVLGLVSAVLTAVAAAVVAVLAPPLAGPRARPPSRTRSSPCRRAVPAPPPRGWTCGPGSAPAGSGTPGPVGAYVGSQRRRGQTREGLSRTPAGVFGLTQAFGNQPNNGTRLPYFQATGRTGGTRSPAARPTTPTCARPTSPGWPSENLYTTGAVYAHAVVIDYNRFPVRPGAGSAFFLHVTNGHPTAGCVAVASSSLDTVMRWLNPAAHPVISIGVGSQATSIITQANAAAAKHNPQGHLDSVTGGRGTVRAVGWAADPDSPSGR